MTRCPLLQSMCTAYLFYLLWLILLLLLVLPVGALSALLFSCHLVPHCYTVSDVGEFTATQLVMSVSSLLHS